MIDRDDKVQQLITNFKTTFAGNDGKSVLKRLSELCHENGPTYVDGNAQGTAYKEGQRSVMLHIRMMLAKDPSVKRQTKAEV